MGRRMRRRRRRGLALHQVRARTLPRIGRMDDTSRSALERRRLMRALLATMAPAGAARAQSVPGEGRPITLVVPFGPGGIADLTARAVAKEMAAKLKQSIVVDNKPSAGAIVGSQQVARAEPDGQTLLLMSNANAVSAGLFRQLPFDAQRDFAPITTLGVFDLALVVPAESPDRTLAQLLARARAKPGSLTIGTIAAGSTQHLAAELFRSMAKIDAVVVPYKATPAVVTALRAKEIDVGFEILGPMIPQIEGKALRALAVTSDRRFPGLPEVPTVKESGLANYVVASWNGLAAPARTPAPVVERLRQAAQAALDTSIVKAQLQVLGVRAQGGTPEQMRELLAGEIKRWADVIVQAKIERQ